MTLVRQLTLAMVSVALLSGVIVGVLVDYEVTDAVEPEELERLQTAMRSEIASLQSYVSGVRSDLMTALNAAPASPLLTAHAQGLPPSAADHDRVVEVYAAMLSAKPHYLILRLLANDVDGREIVRVERDHAGDNLRLVPEIALQAKGDRPYMRATLGAKGSRSSEVYVSPIELRQDHGQVVVPHVPVLRAAIPNYSAGYTRDGVVVLTVDMGPVLEGMQRALDPITHALYLFDRSGNFVLHPEPGRAFGRDLATREDFMSNFPELKGLPQISEPWIGSMRDDQGKEQRLIAIPFKLAEGPDLILLAGGISTASAVTRGVHRAALMAALGAGLLASLLALLISRRVTRPLTQMTRLAERYPSTQGESLPVDAAGEVGSLARALTRMESQIRERNDVIEQEEARFRRVFESVPYATLIVDQDQRIVLANARAETIFGIPAAELLGGELNSLVPEATREAHHAYFSEFLEKPATRPMAMGRALEIRRKDGTTAHVEIGLAPLTAANRNEVLASIVDVSNRVRSEAALRQSNRELEQFAYVASHDLQEPLRMVANYCELLKRRYEGQLDEKADKYIHFAVDGARRMQKLISDLLAYSRVESQGGSFIRVDLNVIVRQVLQSLQVATEEAHATVTIQPLPTVLADTTQMQQLFQNLLDNAIKFRGDRPPNIIVSAGPDNENGEANVVSNDNQGKVRISVQDNGIGVDMQNAHRLFEMFQRGHGRDRFAGTGIGLAVSKRVVERHGGKIWVEPSPAGGSTFCFTLDAAGRRA